MRIAVIADTHMPRGARRVPDLCVEAMRAADAIVHAGDFSGAEMLDWLGSLGPPLHAVRGNVESAAVRARLSDVLEFEADRRRIAVVHDAGPANGRLRRMRLRFPDADAVIFGHSHIPLHEEREGFQIFNPGSPTERRRSPRHSFGIADAGPDGLSFRHIWLG